MLKVQLCQPDHCFLPGHLLARPYSSSLASLNEHCPLNFQRAALLA